MNALFVKFGISNCKVKLRKLTDGDIERKLKKLKAKKSTKPPQTNVPKNTDKTMTILSGKVCVLCDKQQKHLTSHYIQNHVNHEVYHSRMSAENSDYLRHNLPKSPEKAPRSTYMIHCYFCEKDVQGTRTDLLEHTVRHTGEYKKRCSDCRTVITSTTKKTNECSHQKYKAIPNVTLYDEISVYMCNFCNYAQCAEEHIEQHMKKMHDVEGDLTASYKKVCIIRNLTRSTKSTARKSIGGGDNVLESLVDSDSRSSGIASMADSEHNQPIKVEQTDDVELTFRTRDTTPKVTNAATLELMRHMKLCHIKLEIMEESSSGAVTPGPANSKNAIDRDSEDDKSSWESCTSDDDSDDGARPSTSTMSTPLNRSRSKMKATKNRKKMQKRSQSQSQKSPTPKPSPPEEKPQLPVITDIPPKRPPLVNDSDENRVFNMSYSNYLGQLKLKCSVGHCDFVIINNPTNFSNHLKNAHPNEKWNGVCETCDKQILNGAYPLAKEYKHLEDVHLSSKKSESNAVAERQLETKAALAVNVEPDEDPMITVIEPQLETKPAIDASTEADAPVIKPPTMIKLRRLSGDMLSGNALIESDSPNTDLCPRMIISNVVSLSEIDEIKDEDASNATSYKNALKPWTKCQSTKSAISAVKLLSEVSLVALYKCMGADCIFTTNKKDAMDTHLSNHEEFHTKQTTHSGIFVNTDQSSWLECSYCDQVLGSCRMLIDHIDKVHGTSVFQCAYCFYRSTNMEFMKIHKAKYHANVTATLSQSIYACGNDKHDDNQDGQKDGEQKMTNLLHEIENIIRKQTDTSKIECEVPGNSPK